VDYTFQQVNSQMLTHELVINLHIHTLYSDGHARHSEIGKAAILSNLDVVIVTDHNVLVRGVEKYYSEGAKKVLLLAGEEIHDQTRLPQKDHLLVFGASSELSKLASDTKRLLEQIRRIGGVAFIAHPVDPAAPAVNEDDISWINWGIKGYTGIELWNGMSEFKSLLKTKMHAIYYAFNPSKIAHNPFPLTIQKWDELLAAGEHVVAIGGSDAHAFPGSMGPLHRTLFPYEFHFRCINTHLLVNNPLSGILEEDRKMIIEALSSGHAFVGYDLPALTTGFRYTAQGYNQTAIMGDEISAEKGITLQIRLPQPVECQLVKDGKVVKTWNNRESITYVTGEPGVYRVQCFIHFKGKRRGWIFSNPIYIRSRIRTR